LTTATHRFTKIVRVVAIAAAVSTALGMLALRNGPEAATSSGKTARTTKSFVDSIGVNVHLHYSETVYGRFDDLIEPRLAELGVRHIRDGAYTYAEASADTLYYRRLRALGERGIKANLITAIETDHSDRTDIDKLDDVQAWTGGAVEAFEGPNEPDLNAGDSWASETRSIQRALWNKVSDDPALRSVDVVGPSPAFEPDQLGDISRWVDFGNSHPYQGGNCPTCADVYGQSFDTRIDRDRAPTGDKPLIASETGYHNATNSDGEHRPASERAAAKYIPRMLFEYFNRRVSRTYIYELIDAEDDSSRRRAGANFGLLRNDGARKPAFKALRNLIRILDDPGPTFVPGRLAYRIEGHTDNVHRTLLQKRNGRFYLALWQERSSYDTGQRPNTADAISERGDIDVPSQRVTVTTNEPSIRVRLFRPSAGVSETQTWSTTSSVTIDVPDEVVVIELTPASLTPPTATPPELDLTDACGGATPGGFTDVPDDHTFTDEIACLSAWSITKGAGDGTTFEPETRVPRWQMALFVDRLAGLEASDAADLQAAMAAFDDIGKLSREARGAISRMHSSGVIRGGGGRRFRPHRPVTRGQTAAMLNRLHSRTSIATDYFKDDDGNTHESDINAIAAKGIVRGSTGQQFRPNGRVTRGQMAAMVVRYIKTRIDAEALDASGRA